MCLVVVGGGAGCIFRSGETLDIKISDTFVAVIPVSTNHQSLITFHLFACFPLLLCAMASLRDIDYLQWILDWNNCPAVERDRDKVSGAWLFKSTRVPVKALFENLEEGATVDDFLSWFPGVTRAQVLAVLEFAEQSLAVT
jgi:uncharacterized protein (DUF433 family)